MNQLSIAAALVLAAGSAVAQPTIEFLPSGYLVSDLSQDGSVAAGNQVNDGSYETFRWDAETSAVRLGRGSVATIGVGGGSPDVSYDGSFISASILSSDNNLTLGIWSAVDGWHEAMPPIPSGGGSVDQAYGSAWGLSGDGITLTGYYYFGTPFRAVPCTWSIGGGIVQLQHTMGQNSRVNAANYDGTVVAGWDDRGGPWYPVVWRDGVRSDLTGPDSMGRAEAINADGSIIVGTAYDPAIITRVPTIWRWNGASYDIQRLNYLPGTVIGSGQAYFTSVSDDGQIAVGSNIYTMNPGGNRAGIIWTPETGVMKDSDYLASLGLLDQLPPTFVLRELSAVSPDGSTIAGIGLYSDRFEYQSFLIHLNPPPACPGDANGDNVVDGADLSVLLSQFGQSVVPGTGGDLNNDGGVDGADLSVLLSNFGGGGCI